MSEHFRKIFTVVPMDQEKSSPELGPNIPSHDFQGSDDPYIIGESKRILIDWFNEAKKVDESVMRLKEKPTKYLEKTMQIFAYLQNESIDSVGKLKTETVENARTMLDDLFEGTSLYGVLKTNTTYAACVKAISVLRKVQGEFNSIFLERAQSIAHATNDTNRNMMLMNQVEENAAHAGHNLYGQPDQPNAVTDLFTVPTQAAPDLITSKKFDITNTPSDTISTIDTPEGIEEARKVLYQGKAPTAVPAKLDPGVSSDEESEPDSDDSSTGGSSSIFKAAYKAASTLKSKIPGFRSAKGMSKKQAMNHHILKKAGQIKEKQVMQKMSRPDRPEAFTIGEMVRTVPKIKNIITGSLGLNTLDIYEEGEESGRTLTETEGNYGDSAKNYAELFDQTKNDFSVILNQINEKSMVTLANINRAVAFVDDSVSNLTQGEMMEQKYGQYDVPLSQTSRYKNEQNSQLVTFKRQEQLLKLRNLTDTQWNNVSNSRATFDNTLLKGHTTDSTFQNPDEVLFDCAALTRKNDREIEGIKGGLVKKLGEFLQFGAIGKVTDLISAEDTDNLISKIANNDESGAFGYDLFETGSGESRTQRLPVQAQIQILSEMRQQQSLIPSQNYLAYGDSNLALESVVGDEMKINPKSILGLALANQSSDAVYTNGSRFNKSNVPTSFLNAPFLWDVGFTGLALRSFNSNGELKVSYGQMFRARGKVITTAMMTNNIRNPHDMAVDNNEIGGAFDDISADVDSLAAIESKAAEAGLQEAQINDINYNILSSEESQLVKSSQMSSEVNDVFDDMQEYGIAQGIVDDMERKRDITQAAEYIDQSNINPDSVVPVSNPNMVSAQASEPQPPPGEVQGGGISRAMVRRKKTQPNQNDGTYASISPQIMANIILENYARIKKKFDFMNRAPTPVNLLAMELGGGNLVAVHTTLVKVPVPKNLAYMVAVAIRIAATNIGYSHAHNIAKKCLIIQVRDRAIIKSAAKELYRIAHKESMLDKYESSLKTRTDLEGGIPLKQNGNDNNSSGTSTFGYTSASFGRDYQEMNRIDASRITHGEIIQNLQLLSDEVMREYEAMPETPAKRKLIQNARVALAHGGLDAEFTQNLMAAAMATNTLGNIPFALKSFIHNMDDKAALNETFKHYTMSLPAHIRDKGDAYAKTLMDQKKFMATRPTPYKADFLNQPNLVASPVPGYRPGDVEDYDHTPAPGGAPARMGVAGVVPGMDPAFLTSLVDKLAKKLKPESRAAADKSDAKFKKRTLTSNFQF